jgi:hypothetical protein
MTAKENISIENEMALQGHYRSRPWRCIQSGDECALSAFVEASGEWETVAIVQPTSGADAKSLANFILRVVNDWNEHDDLFQAASEALEAVLQEGLTFSTEQEVESMVERLKRLKC